MNKQNYIHVTFVVLIICFYLTILLLKNRNVFSYKFDNLLIEKYLCSQDISHEPPCKRLFLSDGDIHIAAGYLYIKGYEPTLYNFQHPPLIKYLYGSSIILFNNPYIAQIILGIVFLILSYMISFIIFNKISVSIISCLLLIADPLFQSISVSTLLDLGQGVFLLFYLMSMLFYKKNYLVQGVSLGLLIASKFWGGSVFFLFTIFIYLIYKRELNLKKYFYHLGIAAITLSLAYLKTFIDNKGLFNIIIFELKTLKYWLNHSIASIFGSSLLLFFTGYLKSWWGDNQIIRADVWSLLWPISYIIVSVRVIVLFIKKNIKQEFLISFISVFYLLYLGVQAPFIRYFILVLPFFYMILATLIVNKIKKLFSKFR